MIARIKALNSNIKKKDITFLHPKLSQPTIIDIRKFLAGLFISLVLVRMVLQSELPVGPFDLLLRSTLRHLQHVVITLPGHGTPNLQRSSEMQSSTL